MKRFFRANDNRNEYQDIVKSARSRFGQIKKNVNYAVQDTAKAARDVYKYASDAVCDMIRNNKSNKN